MHENDLSAILLDAVVNGWGWSSSSPSGAWCRSIASKCSPTSDLRLGILMNFGAEVVKDGFFRVVNHLDDAKA